ncbi:SMI1/KNR4 family protein [Kallotenue papyrolyticum]|uniref:SMI1/KNR4 family protein n=1 Tax=Kallotenue papyrolyticum TaxID=1325125 RepID=UPI0009DE9857|nr:SMI1/KNR4 family protein [Kallotenue papyrolyticum]
MLNKRRIQALLNRLHPGETIPEGLGDEEIAAFTERTGVAVPSEVAELLRFMNGPYVGHKVLLGIIDHEYRGIEPIYQLYPYWKDRGWLPIGGDGCGNYYVVPTRGEFGPGYPVFFVDTMDDPDVPAYIVASNVVRFVEFLILNELGEIDWPWDKNEVLKKDPDILRYCRIPIPWELP